MKLMTAKQVKALTDAEESALKARKQALKDEVAALERKLAALRAQRERYQLID